MERALPLEIGHFMPQPPVLANFGLDWGDLAIQRFQHGPSLITVPAMRHHLLVFNLGAHLLIEKKHEGGRCERRWAETGQMSITPVGHPLVRNARSNADLLFVHLTPELVAKVAEEVFDVDPAEVTIIPRFAIDDPVLSQLAQIVQAEVAGGAPGARLMADGLARAISLNVLRRHSNLASPNAASAPSGLPAGRLRQVIDHMQASLHDDLPLANLAAISGLTPSHFARAFRQATGQPPHRYLVDLRVARARELLKTTELSVIRVALECGFQQPAHFATAFRKRIGASPRTWRATHRL